MTAETTEGSGGSDLPLEEVVESFIARVRAGERPSIAEYVERYPELEAKIREVLPGLLLVEEMSARGGSETAGGGAAASAAPVVSTNSGRKGPGRVGEYRLLQEIGRGGMGVVYEAVQESLSRHVALKVLPYHTLFGERLQERFRREAQAAAKLQHPNIVPVYGFGEDDGVHYYVMQFVEGRGLDRVLEEVKLLRTSEHGNAERAEASPKPRDKLTSSVALGLLTGSPSAAGGKKLLGAKSSDAAEAASGGAAASAANPREYFQSVARVVRHVAEALDYAHESGILHRDIKPSNLLLDSRGTVWVTDFGLAKDEALGDLTGTGEIVGTLRYMAPERFEGTSDCRSDIYSLGLTLYELLTLRPAFGESDRSRLLKQVMAEEPRRPRTLDRAIPRDLELITLKAMRKDPAERYQSAAELAADMERFEKGLPVSATAPTLRYLARRLVKRHRVATALLGLAAIIAAGYLVWSWAVAQRAKGPVSIVADDFDGDGDLDLATANWDSGNVSVVLDAGREGQFARTYRVGERPALITSADWDQDGSPDLAVELSNSIAILLNRGHGKFHGAFTIDLGETIYFLTRADLNGDGRTDLAAAGTGRNVLVLWNHGAGVFSEPVRLQAADKVTFIAAADVCLGDGLLDLVTASAYGKMVSVLKNNGEGAFASAAHFPSGGMTARMAVADLDGDGDLDLAALNHNTWDSSLLLNGGDGSFSEPVVFPLGEVIQWVAAADLDGDLDNDLVYTAAAGVQHVLVLFNGGKAAFSAPVEVALVEGGPFVLAADWERDGDLDLFVPAVGLNSVVLLLNAGKAVFKQSSVIQLSPW